MPSLQSLLGIYCLAAAPVYGAFQIPDAPASSYKRACPSMSVSKLMAKLYVSNYNGNVTTFHMGTTSTGSLAFKQASKNTQCGSQPTWLNYDRGNKALYCLNEQWNPDAGPATLTKYKVDDRGTLAMDKVVNLTYGGPVHTVFMPQGNTYSPQTQKGLHIVAHYSPGGIGALDQDLAAVSSLNTTKDTPADPGALPNQLGSHVHETIVDPSGKIVFAPDLGNDRVWMVNYASADKPTNEFLEVPAKTGPRHGIFVPLPGYGQQGSANSNSAMFYVVGEISNMIEGYGISYPQAGEPKVGEHVSSTSALQAPIKQGYAAGEIALSPDRRFIVVSNRNNSLSTINECDAHLKGCKSTPADTLVTFKPAADGKLEHVQTWSAGGMLPRSFSINSKGDMIAVGLVSRVVIMDRNAQTGMIGQVIGDATFDTPDAVTNIVWDEVDYNRANKPFFAGQYNVY